MESTLLQQISSYQLKHKKFLLAVSGGVDSMVLLHMFYTLKLNVEVAHVHYGFRKDESDAETKLVQQTCDEYGLPLHVLRKEGYKDLETATESNLQMYARTVRYEFFEQIHNTFQYDYIVTAHHADDQVETVLMNLSKGTGIKGLRGMEILQDRKYKPLLQYFKRQLYDYASENNVLYLEDSSNASTVYLRNFFRNEIVPIIENRIPAFKSNILGTIERLHNVADIYQQYLAQRLPLYIKEDDELGKYIEVRRILLDKHHRDIVLYFLEKENLPTSYLSELLKLMVSQQASALTIGDIRFVKDKGRIYYGLISEKDVLHILEKQEIEAGKQLALSSGNCVITLAAKESINLHEPGALMVAADKLSYPLMIRKVKAGDYFYPFGLNKKKKVAKFLIDQKIPIPLRADTWVVMSGTHLIAVLPYRIHHRFAVQDNTNAVLKFAFPE